MVVMHVGFPLSLRNVEDPFFKRGIDIGHETVLLTRFGPMFAGDIHRAAAGLAHEGFPPLAGTSMTPRYLISRCAKAASHVLVSAMAPRPTGMAVSGAAGG